MSTSLLPNFSFWLVLRMYTLRNSWASLQLTRDGYWMYWVDFEMDTAFVWKFRRPYFFCWWDLHTNQILHGITVAVRLIRTFSSARFIKLRIIFPFTVPMRIKLSGSVNWRSFWSFAMVEWQRSNLQNIPTFSIPFIAQSAWGQLQLRFWISVGRRCTMKSLSFRFLSLLRYGSLLKALCRGFDKEVNMGQTFTCICFSMISTDFVLEFLHQDFRIVTFDPSRWLIGLSRFGLWLRLLLF